MKRKALIFVILLITATVFSACAAKKPEATIHTPDSTGYIPRAEDMYDIVLTAPQAFIYDVTQEEFVLIRGEDEILYPASTTKLLTILYALMLTSPEELVTPADELSLLRENSTIAYIKSHHTLSCEMLIEGMLLPSGNDAAFALAAAAGRSLADSDVSGVEAVSLFVSGMNEYAISLGLCGSTFTSPDGYYDDNHYSTVEDMAIIAREAYKNEIIMKYAGVHRDDVVYASGHTNTWINTNLCLDPESEYYSPLVKGLKTGSAGTDNYSLITVISTDNGDYIAGLFSCHSETDRFHDMKKIIETLASSI